MTWRPAARPAWRLPSVSHRADRGTRASSASVSGLRGCNELFYDLERFFTLGRERLSFCLNETLDLLSTGRQRCSIDDLTLGNEEGLWLRLNVKPLHGRCTEQNACNDAEADLVSCMHDAPRFCPDRARIRVAEAARDATVRSGVDQDKGDRPTKSRSAAAAPSAGNRHHANLRTCRPRAVVGRRARRGNHSRFRLLLAGLSLDAARCDNFPVIGPLGAR